MSAMPPAVSYKDRPLVYVAGPYTSPDPVENTHNTIRLASELIDEGLVTPVVPHLTLLWHAVTPRPIEFWYEYDVAILNRCDAVYRIDGESRGADMEVDFANAAGLPVFRTRDELREWAKRHQASATQD
jgi:nucleoside 2-deoxyribosyltransferase